MNNQELEQLASELRFKIIRQSHLSDIPHLGSCLSCLDILAVLYFKILNVDPKNPENSERDRFVLSKGHAAPALFQVLAKMGFYDASLMQTYNQNGSVFGEHPPAHGIPGIEAATGSLGHGLPIAVGMALAAKMNKQKYKTFALLSDGECNKGSIWEAAMMASAHKLENLIAIIDFNKWQATGRSEEILSINPLADKWRAFGWSASELDGNDIPSLVERLKNIPDTSGKPIAIIAHTVKGKGVSFMEDDNNWHYRMPNKDEVEAARKELGVEL